MAGHGLHVGHVNAIDVRSFLAIDLDTDEPRVQLPGDVGILERLVRHDMAPVAGRIADRQKDRFVFGPRLSKGILSPFEPFHRIFGVLLQVG